MKFKALFLLMTVGMFVTEAQAQIALVKVNGRNYFGATRSSRPVFVEDCSTAFVTNCTSFDVKRITAPSIFERCVDYKSTVSMTGGSGWGNDDVFLQGWKSKGKSLRVGIHLHVEWPADSTGPKSDFYLMTLAIRTDRNPFKAFTSKW